MGSISDEYLTFSRPQLCSRRRKIITCSIKRTEDVKPDEIVVPACTRRLIQGNFESYSVPSCSPIGSSAFPFLGISVPKGDVGVRVIDGNDKENLFKVTRIQF